MGAARDWEAEKRQAATKLLNAKHALKLFMESPAGATYQAAEQAFNDAAKKRERLDQAHTDAEREATIRLGIRRKGRGNDEEKRVFTPEFLAAAAKQIGCTLDEADDIPGENSHHGSRLTGRQLYVAILRVFEDRLVSDDPRVREAYAARRAARAAQKAAKEKLDALKAKHAEVLRGPERVEWEIRRLNDAQTIAEQKAKAAAERIAAKPKKDPVRMERMREVKVRLLAFDAKHTDSRDRFRDKDIRGAPVEWWKG